MLLSQHVAMNVSLSSMDIAGRIQAVSFHDNSRNFINAINKQHVKLLGATRNRISADHNALTIGVNVSVTKFILDSPMHHCVFTPVVIATNQTKNSLAIQSVHDTSSFLAENPRVLSQLTQVDLLASGGSFEKQVEQCQYSIIQRLVGSSEFSRYLKLHNIDSLVIDCPSNMISSGLIPESFHGTVSVIRSASETVVTDHIQSLINNKLVCRSKSVLINALKRNIATGSLSHLMYYKPDSLYQLAFLGDRRSEKTLKPYTILSLSENASFDNELFLNVLPDHWQYYEDFKASELLAVKKLVTRHSLSHQLNKAINEINDVYLCD
ncbi:hypothetical protein DYL72_15325 [Vibrio anguillarum]|uniref:Uncharacterized protein n=1 Tax=Vibrio anguillarum TaxID=55601 RepID=A0A7U6FS21_VIBAN|nr:hypothetical protein [Vibrio anguillarum]AZS26278.1 hypothetical protein DYL72_15325 [Vibrio anguillarum]